MLYPNLNSYDISFYFININILLFRYILKFLFIMLNTYFISKNNNRIEKPLIYNYEIQIVLKFLFLVKIWH